MAGMNGGDPCFIFAGYDDKNMEAFISSNPGLFRRISRVFTFGNYTSEELAQILLLKLKSSGFTFEPALAENAQAIALHGHTHRYRCEQTNGQLIFNPGECAGMMKGLNAIGILDTKDLSTELLRF